MQQDEEYIIEALGINDWSADKREDAVVEASMRTGNAILEQLSDQQRDEYESIINDDHDVIDAWLNANVPDYKDNDVYKEIADGYEDDEEKNNPSKIFANIAWLQLNVPNLQEVIDSTLASYKTELTSGA